MKIDIWSDFACPFCYIGKKNLEIALKEYNTSEEIDIVFRSFQLDPYAEKGNRSDVVTSLAQKYGTTKEQAQEMIDKIVEMAKGVGLEYNYKNMIQTNTLDAHRLVQYAKKLNRDKELIEALFKAHFVEGLDIGDTDVLVKLSQDAGLDGNEVINLLNTDKYINYVEEEMKLAEQLEITSVPFFIIDGKYALSGAQPPEVFLQALKQA